MDGATAAMREHLQKTSGPEVTARVERTAVAILNTLPRGSELGVRTAALMLAATAFGEYGAAGVLALVKENAGGTSPRL